MKRMHIHVAVDSIEKSIPFYTAMFGGIGPAVRKDDYCEWELTDPKVIFAIPQRGAKSGVDHLGIQVETDEELAEMRRRFANAELPTLDQAATTCCYAKSNKSWTVEPQRVAGETFRTLEAAPTYGRSRNDTELAVQAVCCAPAGSAETDSEGCVSAVDDGLTREANEQR